MLISNNELLHNGFPIDHYSERLISFCEHYLGRAITSFDDESSKEAKKRLAWVIFEDKPNFGLNSKLLALKLSDRISDKIKTEVLRYLTCITTLLGDIGECLFIDTCMNNSLVNMKCINIATFEKNIDIKKDTINYDEYIPFSTSLKKIFYVSNGMICYSENDHHNPRDKQRDIGWCLRDNHVDQLQVQKVFNINGIMKRYQDNAKLQIKVTTNCNNIDISKYKYTPIIIFDLCSDGEYFKKQHPDKVIYTMREISSEAQTEIEWYFKILAAYALGYSDHIDIRNLDISQSNELQSLFSMPLQSLREVSPDNEEKLVKLISINKPVYILGV